MSNQPYLYILMRNDMSSLNCGKSVAQGAHAANQMVHEFPMYVRNLTKDSQEYQTSLFNEWTGSTIGGFGTTIVLSVSEDEMRATVHTAKSMNMHAGIMTDPTYPFEAPMELAKLLVLAGDVLGIEMVRPPTASNPNALLVRSEDVCGYVFGSKEVVSTVLGRFPLMP
jgi:peptidyl-tRNA hydrolase